MLVHRFAACLAFPALVALHGETAAPSRAATPAEASLLMDALQKTAGDLPRWAYTETRVLRDEKGKTRSEAVIRYDPSKPYAEQWRPISINGKAPAPKDLEKYRKQGERAQRRDERVERGQPDSRRTLGELIDPRTARVVRDDGTRIIFEIPLRKDGNDRFPPEKFEVLARIERASGALENIAVRLRESFRSKLILKVKSGDGTLDFERVDPKYPATLTAIRGDASASIMFVSVGGELELTRTELKHVKPFNERFDVQIGTLKAIDF
ncbi:MAG TPA: hypothetical protein VM029_10715 [Opitutaceae bacterium]|nr:hypothetical protein [Opitutaceae bacterium]